MTVADTVRAAREAAGLSQVQLAERAGVTPQRISSLELGKWAPSQPLYEKLREILPDLPERMSLASAKPNGGLGVSKNGKNWHGLHSDRKCTDAGGHAWWYSGSGLLRACERIGCPVVERKR